MAEKIEVGVTIKGTQKVSSDLSKIDDKTKDLGGNVDAASGALDKMTGGAISAFKGIISGVKKAVIGMKTLRTAMISTGIGALVVAVASLVAYFTSTQKGAEKLEIAMAGLKIVFAKITDVASSLGEIIVGLFTDPVESIKDFGGVLQTFVMDRVTNLMDGLGLVGSAIAKLFSGDFSGAMDDAVKGVENLAMANPLIAGTVLVVDELVDATKTLAKETVVAVSASNKLSKRSIQLRKDQRDLALGFAEGRAQIKEYNLIAEDTTKSLEERTEAAQKAIDIEKGLMAERQRIAQEEVDIQKEKMALSENVEADQQKLVDLEVSLINIRTESAEMQTTLNNKLNIIRQQSAAAAQAEADAVIEAEKEKQDALAATAEIEAEIRAEKEGHQFNAEQSLRDYLKTEEELEIEAFDKKRAGLLMANLTAGEDANALDEKLRIERQAITDKYNAKEVATAEATAQAVRAARLGIVAAGFEALKSMAKTEEGQKRLAISQILVNQGIAMSEAFKAAQVAAAATGPAAPVMSPLFTAQMIGMVLSSFASIKGVMNQAGASSGAVGTSSGGGGGGGVGGSTQLALTPTLDSFGEGTLELPAVQAYVLQNNIADADALQQALQNQSSL